MLFQFLSLLSLVFSVSAAHGTNDFVLWRVLLCDGHGLQNGSNASSRSSQMVDWQKNQIVCSHSDFHHLHMRHCAPIGLCSTSTEERRGFARMSCLAEAAVYDHLMLCNFSCRLPLQIDKNNEYAHASENDAQRHCKLLCEENKHKYPNDLPVHCCEHFQNLCIRVATALVLPPINSTRRLEASCNEARNFTAYRNRLPALRTLLRWTTQGKATGSFRPAFLISRTSKSNHQDTFVDFVSSTKEATFKYDIVMKTQKNVSCYYLGQNTRTRKRPDTNAPSSALNSTLKPRNATDVAPRQERGDLRQRTSRNVSAPTPSGPVYPTHTKHRKAHHRWRATISPPTPKMTQALFLSKQSTPGILRTSLQVTLSENTKRASSHSRHSEKYAEVVSGTKFKFPGMSTAPHPTAQVQRTSSLSHASKLGLDSNFASQKGTLPVEKHDTGCKFCTSGSNPAKSCTSGSLFTSRNRTHCTSNCFKTTSFHSRQLTFLQLPAPRFQTAPKPAHTTTLESSRTSTAHPSTFPTLSSSDASDSPKPRVAPKYKAVNLSADRPLEGLTSSTRSSSSSSSRFTYGFSSGFPATSSASFQTQYCASSLESKLTLQPTTITANPGDQPKISASDGNDLRSGLHKDSTNVVHRDDTTTKAYRRNTEVTSQPTAATTPATSTELLTAHLIPRTGRHSKHYLSTSSTALLLTSATFSSPTVSSQNLTSSMTTTSPVSEQTTSTSKSVQQPLSSSVSTAEVTNPSGTAETQSMSTTITETDEMPGTGILQSSAELLPTSNNNSTVSTATIPSTSSAISESETSPFFIPSSTSQESTTSSILTTRSSGESTASTLVPPDFSTSLPPSSTAETAGTASTSTTTETDPWSELLVTTDSSVLSSTTTQQFTQSSTFQISSAFATTTPSSSVATSSNSFNNDTVQMTTTANTQVNTSQTNAQSISSASSTAPTAPQFTSAIWSTEATSHLF